MFIQAKYDQHQEKAMRQLAGMMNGAQSVQVLIDGTALNIDDSLNKKILREPLNDIRPAPSMSIPAVKSQNGHESYYRFV